MAHHRHNEKYDVLSTTTQLAAVARGAKYAEASAPAENNANCTWLKSNVSASMISYDLPANSTVCPSRTFTS